MSKKALLVGINRFQGGINPLRGCINDTKDVEDLLLSLYHFDSSQIKILENSRATSQGIRDGLSWLLSDYEGGGKDVRIFHFSSHGTQVDDQSGDEWECKDEVIVPYDHDWDKPFRDDDLRQIFDAIPPDVNFTFIADCCHSGSIQKDLLDTKVPFRVRYLTPPDDIRRRIEEARRRRDQEANKWATAQLGKMLEEVPKELWPVKIPEFMEKLLQRFRDNRYGVVRADRHVLLAACEDRQVAADARIEGAYHGAFTYYLGQIVRAANGDITYNKLIQLAGKKLVRYGQTPQLECPDKLKKRKLFAELGE